MCVIFRLGSLHLFIEWQLGKYCFPLPLFLSLTRETKAAVKYGHQQIEIHQAACLAHLNLYSILEHLLWLRQFRTCWYCEGEIVLG